MSRTRNNSRLFLLLSTVGLGVQASAQTLHNNGAAITIQAGAGVYVNGSLLNATGSSITNNGSLSISGNTTNNGTVISPAGASLVLQGTTPQTLGGASPLNVKDLVVNNPAGISVTTPLNIDGAVTFTNGVITAASSSSPVVFSVNGNVSGSASNASHIDGYVQKNGTGAFTFPIGDATRYQPVGVNLSANAGGMTARYYGADAGSAPFGTGGSSAVALLYYNKSEYWDLVPATTATGTVTVYFDSYNNTGIGNTADLRVAHKSGGQWQNEGGTASGTMTSGAVTSNSISSFSPFTLGSIATASPLPVHLISFDGAAEAAVNRLQWKTAVEDAGTTFSLERSADGRDFVSLGNVAGAGPNSSYEVADKQPLSLGYYRLRITGGGAAASFSRTVAIRNAGAGKAQLSVYPMPATGHFFIRADGSALQGTTATVLDAQGRIVVSTPIGNTTKVLTGNWIPGAYTLRLADGTVMMINKL